MLVAHVGMQLVSSYHHGDELTDIHAAHWRMEGIKTELWPNDAPTEGCLPPSTHICPRCWPICFSDMPEELLRISKLTDSTLTNFSCTFSPPPTQQKLYCSVIVNVHLKLQLVHLNLTQIHKLVHKNQRSGLKEHQVLRLGVVDGQRHHYRCKRTPTLTPHTASSIDFHSKVISARWEQLWCRCQCTTNLLAAMKIAKRAEAPELDPLKEKKINTHAHWTTKCNQTKYRHTEGPQRLKIINTVEVTETESSPGSSCMGRKADNKSLETERERERGCFSRDAENSC